MAKQVFAKKTAFENISAQELFDWHERPGAFNRLNPPWEKVELLRQDKGIRDGSEVHLKITLMGPIKQRWRIAHADYVYGKQFKDVQLNGTFPEYEHNHLMHVQGTGSELEDRINYTLPLGTLGQIFGGRFVRSKFQKMFNYRHNLTRSDLTLHHRYRDQARLNVAITGASGTIGSALCHFLTTGGHQVIPLVRQPSATEPNAVVWQPTLHPEALAGVDVVVHLAGENIAGKRWSEDRKREILESRAQSTRQLAETLAKMPNPPQVVSASAIGFYGNRGAEWMDETSPPGVDFLAEVCQAWEAAWQPAIDAGIRVVMLRFGVVLTRTAGILQKLYLPFSFGAGGIIGNGKQYVSWITLDDVLGILYHAMYTPEMQGVYNAVAPNPVTNREFTKTMGKVMHRPTIVPLPAFAARLMFGELADALLLDGQRVASQKVQSAGYQFLYPHLEPALRYHLGC